MKSRPYKSPLTWAIVSAVLFTGLSAWHLTEPRYEGKTPHEWFSAAVELGPMPRGLGGPREEWKASFDACGEAFQQLGARGIRMLVDEHLRRQPLYLEWYDRAAKALDGVITLPARQRPSPFRREVVVARQLLLQVGHAAAPELIRGTYSRSAEVRGHAASLLGELGPGNPAAQRRLLALRNDVSTEVVYRALEVVWMTLPEAETAVPLMLPFLSHTNGRVRVEASYAIGGLPPMPDLTFDRFVATLSDVEGTARANAARAIGLAGRRSEAAVAALEAQLDDPDAVSHFRASEALARMLDRQESSRHARLLEVVTEAETSDRDYFRLIGFTARIAMEGAEMPIDDMIETFRSLLSSPMTYIRRDGIVGMQEYLEARGGAPHPELESLLQGAQADPNGLIRHLARVALDNLSRRDHPSKLQQSIRSPWKMI
jgi:HEAT repeat protein